MRVDKDDGHAGTEGDTIAWDRYLLAIEAHDHRQWQSYRLDRPLLQVAVMPSYAADVRSIYRVGDAFCQDPVDRRLRASCEETVEFLLQAHIKAVAERLERLAGRMPIMQVQREGRMPLACPCQPSVFGRIRSIESVVGYRPDLDVTERYTSAGKPELDRFFIASSSGPRP
jgi:hypothetical protein